MLHLLGTRFLSEIWRIVCNTFLSTALQRSAVKWFTWKDDDEDSHSTLMRHTSSSIIEHWLQEGVNYRRDCRHIDISLVLDGL